MSTSSHKQFHRLYHEQFHASQAEGGLHQPAQQRGGKAASEKKAQHGKKKPSFIQCSYLDPRSLSQNKSWGWKEELRIIPKAAHEWKFQTRKTLCKLITGGLAEVFNGKRDSWKNPLHFKHFAPFISCIQHFSPCRKGQGGRLWWLYLVGCGGFASALI